MATSGWQDERVLTTWSAGRTTIGNIAIDGMSHNGDSLRVWGTVAVGRRGGGCQWWNYGVRISVAGDGERYIINGGTEQCTGNDAYSSFDVTVYVPAAQTSWDIPVYFRACYNSDCSSIFWDKTEYWHLDFGTGGSAPSVPWVVQNWATWDSINLTSTISSFNGIAGNIECIVVTGSSNLDAAYANSGNWTNIGRKAYRGPYSWTTWYQTTATNDNVYLNINNPIDIKGLLHYKIGVWADNSAGYTGALDDTLRYLPPAPSQLTYAVAPGAGARTYRFKFVGITANNHTTYDTNELWRVLRYKIDNGQWVEVPGLGQQNPKAINAETTFEVELPAQSTITVEGWQVYHGMQSEVSSVTVTNTNAPVNFYGPVSSLSKRINHLYGSLAGIANVVLGEATGGFAGIDDVQVFIRQANARLMTYVSDGYEIDSISVSRLEGGITFDAYITMTRGEDDLIYYICQESPIATVETTLQDDWGIGYLALPDPSAPPSTDTRTITADYATTKKIIKLYGSKDGVARKVFDDV